MSNAGKKSFNKRLMDSTEKKINETLQSSWDCEYEWQDAGEPDIVVSYENETDSGEPLDNGEPASKNLEFFEVETKFGWKDDEFPFNTIHIPARKYKYLPWQPLTFIVFNKTCSHALVIPSDEICKDGWLTIKDTRYTDDEVFFTVRYEPDRHLYKADELDKLLSDDFKQPK